MVVAEGVANRLQRMNSNSYDSTRYLDEMIEDMIPPSTNNKRGKKHRRQFSAPTLLRKNSSSSYNSSSNMSSRSLKKSSSMSIQQVSSSATSVASSLDNSSRPRSALRRGKFTGGSGVTSAAQHRRSNSLDVVALNGLFNSDANNKNTTTTSLYEVLQISPDADGAAVRRAYLSQGRKCLAVNTSDDSTTTPHRNLDEVPAIQRRKFQAISIAYEILSTPHLRSDYDKYGVVCALSPRNASELQNPNSVRWRPYVEEKIITDSHPNEHLRPEDDDSQRSMSPVAELEDSSSVSSNSEQSSQQDYHGISWFESRIRKFDKEAEKFLSGDKIDQLLDEGVVEIKKSIDSIGAIGTIIGQRVQEYDASLAKNLRDSHEQRNAKVKELLLEQEKREQAKSNTKSKILLLPKHREEDSMFRKQDDSFVMPSMEKQQQQQTTPQYQQSRQDDNTAVERGGGSSGSMIGSFSPLSVIGEFAAACCLSESALYDCVPGRDDDLAEFNQNSVVQ